MLVHNLPEPSGVGIGRYALEHDRGRPVRKRSVHDVGVAGDPPDVCRAPVDVPVVIVEYVVMGHRGIRDVTARGMQHPFGLSSGAGCIQDEQRILGVHFFRRAVFRFRLHEIVIPMVPAGLPRHLASGSVDHNDMLDTRGTFARRVAVRLEGDPPAAADSLVGRNQDLAG